MGSKAGSASKIRLSSFDDLFGSAENTAGEQIIHVKLADLHTFKGHPFRVLDDEKMEETTESIRRHGVLVPGLARPKAEGGYEIIAGHRSKRLPGGRAERVWEKRRAYACYGQAGAGGEKGKRKKSNH